ncbi:MAG: RdgB/HAM1 family non-canonical purine NTP pyrophosphatase [Desulfovibrio sp.]|nr:RdgB/HAM1 family non-canonical purine NTP pyrophosphatase [Desulfovibrio sp.]
MKESLQVVLATSNAGKIRELATPLRRFGITLRCLADFPDIGPIVEDGESFAENALIKAKTVMAKTHMLSLADDSGLMVAYLNGAPGVYSSRYGSDLPFLPNETKDQRNMRKLLAAMEGVPKEKRQCRFVTAMAMVKPDGQSLLVEGQWEGRLLEAPVGENGFGYDPIFFDEELGTSAASLSLEQKNARSHRGKAVQALLRRLPAFLGIEGV